jgi:hypothetical protein
MFESLERNFSLIIAFILPGFLFLFGTVFLVTYSSADFVSQLRPIRQIGGFMFFLLAATSCGMILSAIRWAVLDTLHCITGLKSPALDFGKLEGKSSSFMLIVENNYRYYLFYGNSLIALLGLFMVAWLEEVPLAQRWLPMLFSLMAVLFLASRDSLRRFYSRTSQIIGIPTASPKKSNRRRRQ